MSILAGDGPLLAGVEDAFRHVLLVGEPHHAFALPEVASHQRGGGRVLSGQGLPSVLQGVTQSDGTSDGCIGSVVLTTPLFDGGQIGQLVLAQFPLPAQPLERRVNRFDELVI